MAVKNNEPLPGLVMVLLSLACGGYITRFLWKAFSNGFVPGKLGAIHYAGSLQYIASIIGCILGLVFVIALTVMGLRLAGLMRQEEKKSR